MALTCFDPAASPVRWRVCMYTSGKSKKKKVKLSGLPHANKKTKKIKFTLHHACFFFGLVSCFFCGRLVYYQKKLVALVYAGAAERSKQHSAAVCVCVRVCVCVCVYMSIYV